MTAAGVLDGVADALSGLFLSPLGLVALAAALPILALYLLKPSPTRVAFPAVEFLAGNRERSRRHPALRRLQRSVLLLVQLVAVVLFAVSLAAPYVPVAEEAVVEETVVVVDDSASMATETGGGTRFDRAVAAATSAATAETSIVTSASGGRVRARRVPPAEAASTLDSLDATDAPGDLGAAIRQAVAVAGRDARIVVCSDFASDEGWPTAVSTARAHGYTVSLEQLDDGGESNVGIVGTTFAGGNVTVRVKNTGASPAERTLSLGGETTPLALQPGDVTSATFPVPAGGGSVRLRPGDSFPVDDVVPVAAPTNPSIRILVVTNEVNRPLVTALSVIRGTEVTVKRPPASIGGRYDVVVFSAVEPGRVLDGTRQVARETLARGGGVVVQAQPRLGAVDYGGLLPVEPTGTGESPALRRPVASHLTADVTFPSPRRYVSADLRTGRALLRTVNGTPLLVEAPVDDGTVLYFGYTPNGSTFEHNYRYPVFWQRAVHDLAGRRPLAAMNRRTGERLALGGERVVETPTGNREASTLTLGRVGSYEVGGDRYAAALRNPVESNVTAPPVAERDGSPAAGGRSERQQVPLDLTHLSAGLVAGAVLLEVALLKRRGDL